jgi:hypothetical protein
MGRVEVFRGDDCAELTWDARIASLRWDLVPWALTLDLDLPISEAAEAPLKRVWLIFEGVIDVTLPLLLSAVPNGIWLTSSISRKIDVEKSSVFSCDAILGGVPTLASVQQTASRILSIRSMTIQGAVSVESAKPSKSGLLEYQVRNGLASDAEMLAALSEYEARR